MHASKINDYVVNNIKRMSVLRIMAHFVQASVKGAYTPLADTLKQVDSITKDDIVKVSYDRTQYDMGYRPLIA